MVCRSIASYSFLIIAVATILPQALIVRLKSDRARALAMTGSLIGAAAYGVTLLDHGVAETVLASVLLGVSPLVTPSISAVASVSTAAQGAALGAMSATQAFGFLVGPLLASYLYSIQHSLPLMVDAGILLLCAAMAMRLPRRLQAGLRRETMAVGEPRQKFDLLPEMVHRHAVDASYPAIGEQTLVNIGRPAGPLVQFPVPALLQLIGVDKIVAPASVDRLQHVFPDDDGMTGTAEILVNPQHRERSDIRLRNALQERIAFANLRRQQVEFDEWRPQNEAIAPDHRAIDEITGGMTAPEDVGGDASQEDLPFGRPSRADEIGFEEGRLVFRRDKTAYGRLVGLMAHLCLHVF